MADDKATEAEEAKALGNAAFKAKQYPEAVTHFTTAIAADPKNHVLYSNRSAAHAAAEEYKRSQQEQEQPLADAEDSRRNALVHKLALDWGAHPGE